MDSSQLPEELVEKIATEHLENLSQLTAFSGICKSWRSTAIRLHSSRRRCFPGLLVPKSTPLQSPIKAYYNGDLIHEVYLLTAVSPAAIPSSRSPSSSPPVPHASLSLFPYPFKISDALDQRGQCLDLHHYLVNKLPPAPTLKRPNYNYSDHDRPRRRNARQDDYYYNSDARCLGSKDGWILRSFPTDYNRRQRQDLYLLNPITGASIPLPPRPRDRESDFCKAIVSSSPNDDDDDECHVFIVSGKKRRISWCEVSPSGQGWKFINYSHSPEHYYPSPKDAIYFEGKLYVAETDRVICIDHDGLIKEKMASEVEQFPSLKMAFPSTSPVEPTATSFPFSEAMTTYRYEYSWIETDYHLCHVNGQLHVILRRSRRLEWWRSSILSFQVFKLLVRQGGRGRVGTYRWEEVRSLDGHGVFLGPHETFSIPAARGASAAADGVRGDHIYFTRRERKSVHNDEDWGCVFDLVNQKLESFAFHRPSSYEKESPCFWFLPMPWENSKLHNYKDDAEEEKAWKREHLLRTTANKHGDGNSNSTVTSNNKFQALLSYGEDDR